MKQQTRRLAAAVVCKAELYEGPCKASRELMGNHQDIIIDALSKSRKRQVEREFANAGIECGQIYCHQTEQDVVLQLADYMAGFLRDYEERRTSSRQEQGYPGTMFNTLRGKLGITKLLDERTR